MKPPLRVPLGELTPGVRVLPPEASVYVARVHRLGPGDALVMFDPEQAVEADAQIVDVGKRAVAVQIEAPRAPARRAARSITLMQGIGKGDRMDAIVRDATELGVTRIVPVVCARSVARPGEERAARWRRIAVEAARQCGRGDVPAITAPLGFVEAVREAMGDVRICLDPGASRGLGEALARLGDDAVVFSVGPEGGFTDGELAGAEAGGFVRTTLGPLLLRTETVCAAMLGALLVLSRTPTSHLREPGACRD